MCQQTTLIQMFKAKFEKLTCHNFFKLLESIQVCMYQKAYPNDLNYAHFCPAV